MVSPTSLPDRMVSSLGMERTEFGEKGSDCESTWSLRDRRWRLRRREMVLGGGWITWIWVSGWTGCGSVGGGDEEEEGGFSSDLW